MFDASTGKFLNTKKFAYKSTTQKGDDGEEKSLNSTNLSNCSVGPSSTKTLGPHTSIQNGSNF